jgi:hypothetical protein
VTTALETAEIAVGPFPGPREHRWWRLASVVQWIVSAAFIAGLLWLWFDPGTLRAGGDPRPVIVVAAAIAIGASLAATVRAGGIRSSLEALEEYRDRWSTEFGARLDRSIGGEIRTLLRARAEIAGALTELGIAATELQATYAEGES